MPKSRCSIIFEDGEYILIVEDDEYCTTEPDLFVLVRRSRDSVFKTLDEAIKHAQTEWGFTRDQILIQLSSY